MKLKTLDNEVKNIRKIQKTYRKYIRKKIPKK